MIARVDAVGGGAVGGDEEEGVTEVLKAGTNGEYLVVGMSKEGEHTRARKAIVGGGEKASEEISVAATGRVG